MKRKKGLLIYMITVLTVIVWCVYGREDTEHSELITKRKQSSAGLMSENRVRQYIKTKFF